MNDFLKGIGLYVLVMVGMVLIGLMMNIILTLGDDKEPQRVPSYEDGYEEARYDVADEYYAP